MRLRGSIQGWSVGGSTFFECPCVNRVPQNAFELWCNTCLEASHAFGLCRTFLWTAQWAKILHSGRKSHKKYHSTFWATVNFGEFLKTWNLRSNSVTRRVNFNRTKIGEFLKALSLRSNRVTRQKLPCWKCPKIKYSKMRQTVLSDRFFLFGQKLVENAKMENSNATFSNNMKK